VKTASEKSGDLILELQESNLGNTDQSMRFAWNDAAHLFIGRGIVGASASDRAHRDHAERQGIRDALEGCFLNEPRIVVPAATTGQRTAYHALSMRSEFPDTLKSGRAEKRRFWRHVEAMRHTGDIVEAEHRKPDGHKITQMLPCDESANA
jgi:hypothetical protein